APRPPSTAARHRGRVAFQRSTHRCCCPRPRTRAGPALTARPGRRMLAGIFAFANNFPWSPPMKFGYFTLSDNRYPNNPRSPEQFVREIFRQALHAEKIGLNSAWIGDHHFNLLGVNPCPNMLLAQLAGATTRIRLAPA